MLRHAAGIVLVMLCVAGCYESALPLDAAPQTDIDQRIVGGWRCMFAEPDGNAVFAMEVKRAGDQRYAVTTMVAGGEPGRFEAHASLVNGAPLVNVRALDIEPGEKPWIFARYTFLRPNVLFVRAADGDALEDVEASPTAVRKAIERAMDPEDLFEDAFMCLRLK